MLIIDNKSYAKTKHPVMEIEKEDVKKEVAIPVEEETINDVKEVPELVKVISNELKDPLNIDIKEYHDVVEKNDVSSSTEETDITRTEIKEDAYTTPSKEKPGSKDEFGRVYVYSVESELHELYTKHYTTNISCLYDILSKINDTQYNEFRAVLKLPERKIINDTVFIKSFEIKYNDLTDANAVFYIILDSSGKPVPSYNNQYVKIHPSYGIISGGFKNFIIAKEKLNLRYVIGMADSDLEYDIMNVNNNNSYGYDAQYHLPILTHINKIYTYDNTYVNGVDNPFLYIKSIEGTEVSISVDKVDYINMREKREKEYRMQADMARNANKYGTRKYTSDSFSSKSSQQFIEERMINSIIDIYSLAKKFDWDSLLHRDMISVMNGNRYNMNMEQEQSYLAVLEAQELELQNNTIRHNVQETSSSFKSRRRLF